MLIRIKELRSVQTNRRNEMLKKAESDLFEKFEQMDGKRSATKTSNKEGQKAVENHEHSYP